MLLPCIAEASTTEEPDAGNTARPGLCGGRRVTGVPTAEILYQWNRKNTEMDEEGSELARSAILYIIGDSVY